MRTSMAFFAGAATVIAAIAVGLGGGLVIANMVSPTPAKLGTETSSMERRKAAEPVAAKIGPSEPVQYLATPSAPGTAVAPALPQPEPVAAAAQTEAANAPSTPAASTPATPPASDAAAASTAQPVAAAERPAAVAQAKRPTAAQDAFAKAQEADLRRDGEVKRLIERRRVERERRQQSADRPRPQAGQGDELREVEAVRDDTEPLRRSAFEPARAEMPRIKLFGEN